MRGKISGAECSGRGKLKGRGHGEWGEGRTEWMELMDNLRMRRGLLSGVPDSGFPLYGMGAPWGCEHTTFSEIVQQFLHPPT